MQQTLTAEGGNELTCCMLLEHLWRIGYVQRFKLQPFALAQLGGPSNALPDVLVELPQKRLVVIEVKARRYISTEVLEQLERNREFLARHGLPMLLWSDRDDLRKTDVLNPTTRLTVQKVTRGRVFTLSQDDAAVIQQELKSGATQIEHLTRPEGFSWDAVMCAISKNIITIDVTQVLNEQTRIFQVLPVDFYANLFGERSLTTSWWNTLSDC